MLRRALAHQPVGGGKHRQPQILARPPPRLALGAEGAAVALDLVQPTAAAEQDAAAEQARRARRAEERRQVPVIAGPSLRVVLALAVQVDGKRFGQGCALALLQLQGAQRRRAQEPLQAPDPLRAKPRPQDGQPDAGRADRGGSLRERLQVRRPLARTPRRPVLEGRRGGVGKARRFAPAWHDRRVEDALAPGRGDQGIADQRRQLAVAEPLEAARPLVPRHEVDGRAGGRLDGRRAVGAGRSGQPQRRPRRQRGRLAKKQAVQRDRRLEAGPVGLGKEGAVQVAVERRGGLPSHGKEGVQPGLDRRVVQPRGDGDFPAAVPRAPAVVEFLRLDARVDRRAHPLFSDGAVRDEIPPLLRQVDDLVPLVLGGEDVLGGPRQAEDPGPRRRFDSKLDQRDARQEKVQRHHQLPDLIEGRRDGLACRLVAQRQADRRDEAVTREPLRGFRHLVDPNGRVEEGKIPLRQFAVLRSRKEAVKVVVTREAEAVPVERPGGRRQCGEDLWVV
nr:hypothetical protein ABAZ39_14455 [Azospirillum argentinense]